MTGGRRPRLRPRVTVLVLTVTFVAVAAWAATLRTIGSLPQDAAVAGMVTNMVYLLWGSLTAGTRFRPAGGWDTARDDH